MLEFNIPLGSGKRAAHAKLYPASDASGTYGLTLHDGSGHPSGKGRTLSEWQARQLAKALETCKPAMRISLVWAALGYERKTHKPVASAMCHPGSLRLTGRP